jgi:mxaJ protein
MFSRYRTMRAESMLAAACAAAALLLAPLARAAAEPLRVCADPNNLPFSDRAEAGFENEVAALVARALARDVEYTWYPQRRGFIRNTLNARLCDVVLGVPAGYELVRTTQPYYRSTYVFVYPRDGAFEPTTLDDPQLKSLKIGVPVVGDDYASTPGAAALGRRGLIDNMVGYSVYGDYSKPNPPARLIEGVAAGNVDMAIAWGPLAGYFAQRESVPLAIKPVTPEADGPFIPFTFAIAMGVRKDDAALAAALDDVIATHRDEIRALLERYGVPLVASPAGIAHNSEDDR